MGFDLQSLYDMQNELDRRIEKEKGLEHEDLFEKKVLALFVEVGELANETRCFKFWSLKPASVKEVILEEYVDGLHFVLSIGLILPFDVPQYIHNEQSTSMEPVQAFIKVFESISSLKNNRTDVNKYNQLMEDYLMIGRILGYTIEEIRDAYLAKNEVNHTRQDQGY